MTDERLSIRAHVDDALRSYLETALWSCTDESDESGGKPLDESYEVEDFADEAINQADRELEGFFDLAEPVLRKVRKRFGADDESIAHDFWLTRNGHGAGFWDRGWGELGERLTAHAKTFGTCHAYVGDDGKLHFHG